MADLKISALTAATTPLVGTEVVPLVQGGTTKKVAVSDLTAGRDVNTKTISATNTAQRLATFTRTGSSGLLVEADNAGPVLQPTTVESIQIYNVAGALRQFRFRTDSGNLELASGNLVIGTSGKGIDFSATSGTGTSELLSDYEEGTWTPDVTAGTGTITSYTSTGTYTKVGRQVTLLGEITITNSGTGSTYLIVAGLPFGISGTLVSGAGREIQSAGQQCSVSYQSGSSFNINHYNNNNIVVTNYKFSFVTVYFV